MKRKEIKHEVEPLDFTEVDSEKEYSKKLELEAKKVLKKGQADQMSDMRDSQYYCCVIFANKADRDKFLGMVNDSVEVQGNTFIDGYDFCDQHFEHIECSASLPVPHYAKEVGLVSKQKKLKL